MKRFYHGLSCFCMMAVLPGFAGAVGTFYDGNLYKSPQSKYAPGNGGYYNTYGAGRGYGQYSDVQSTQNIGTVNTVKTTQKTASSKKSVAEKKSGFAIDAGFQHEFGSWQFDMSQAGSQLHYDNLVWNVATIDGAYYFGDSVPMQIKVGARYGKQFGETSMVDDDISNGPYAYQDIEEGRQVGYAMSIGTSDGGTQTGFNVEFGLTDFFTAGRVKITPSVGYRYFKHDLKTNDNHGLTMDVLHGSSEYNAAYKNFISSNGETQYDPFIVFLFYDASGQYLDYAVTGRIEDENGNLTNILADLNSVPSGTQYVTIDLGDTYFYEQSGNSHKYETVWSGPYIAFDAEYAIDNTNTVVAGLELGLPMYDSKGDQPYRIDWQHPTSVEDKAGFGHAYHLGMNAQWNTMLTDSVSLSLGINYDFYKARGADAQTFLNSGYYDILLGNGFISQEEYDSYASKGWTLEAKEEIDSVYRSMGLRVGLGVKF